jgi:hypothetical protein
MNVINKGHVCNCPVCGNEHNEQEISSLRDYLAAAKDRIAQRDAQIAVYNSGGFADADALAEKFLAQSADLAAARAEEERLDRELEQCRALLGQSVNDVQPLRDKLAAARAAIPEGWSVRTNCDGYQQWLVITGPRGQSAACEVDIASVRADVLRELQRAFDAALKGE